MSGSRLREVLCAVLIIVATLPRGARAQDSGIVTGSVVAYDPVTGQSLNSIVIGAYVPGTGNEANGMVKETDPGVPAGFRQVLKPRIRRSSTIPSSTTTR